MILTGGQIENNIQSCVNCCFQGGKPAKNRGTHDYTIYKQYERFEHKNTNGIIADYPDGIREISFQGSDDPIDWKQNFDIKHVVTPFPGVNPEIKISRGFLEAYENVRDIVLDAAYENPRMIITGHSHGSALSLIGYRDIIWHAAHKWKKPVDIACVQVAGPRVFNIPGMYSFKKCEGMIYLIELNNDPVTNVPPEKFGFRHVFNRKIDLRLFPYVPIFELPLLRYVSVWNHYPQRYLEAMKKFNRDNGSHDEPIL